MMSETKYQLNKKLIAAVRKSELAEIKYCLDHGADIETMQGSEYGYTPLILALALRRKTCDMDIVSLLVSRGADINGSLGCTDGQEKARYIQSSLMTAIMAGKTDAVEFLVKSGADVNLKIYNGNTPLIAASVKNDTSAARLMLENGADITYGALITHALKNGSMDMAELLIEAGADINAKDDMGDTPLHIAAFKGFTGMLRTLTGLGADINAENGIGSTPLIDAVLSRQKDAAFYLIEHGADVNAKDEYRQTPLTVAVKIKENEIAEKLLEAGADPKKTGPEGHNALRTAVWNNNSGIIPKLLETDTSIINIKDFNEDTALMTAILLADQDTAELLIRSGADVNITGGNSPLAAAIYTKTKEKNRMIPLLLKAGADPNFISRINGHRRTPLMWAVACHRMEYIPLLIRNGASVNDFTDENGNTALHLAAKNGSVMIMKQLLVCGSGLGFKNNKDETPLDILRKEYPGKYEKCAIGLMEMDTLYGRYRIEDIKKTVCTGFDFDI